MGGEVTSKLSHDEDLSLITYVLNLENQNLCYYIFGNCHKNSGTLVYSQIKTLKFCITQSFVKKIKLANYPILINYLIYTNAPKIFPPTTCVIIKRPSMTFILKSPCSREK